MLTYDVDTKSVWVYCVIWNVCYSVSVCYRDMSRCVAGDALEETSASETDDASDDDGSAIVMYDRLPQERSILRTTEKLILRLAPDTDYCGVTIVYTTDAARAWLCSTARQTIDRWPVIQTDHRTVCVVTQLHTIKVDIDLCA